MPWQFTGKAPVYQQIVSRIRADILNGIYKPDEQVPSVRQLAMEAGVNPNTMQRALTELEDEKLFITRGTVGRFITSDRETLEKARRVMRDEAITCLIEDAEAVGITREELIRCLTEHPAPAPGAGSPGKAQ